MNEMNKNIIALITHTLIENIDDSSDSSEDELDTEILKELNGRTRVPRIRCKNYVENIVSSYSDMEFKTHFRMKRSTFIFLLELLTPHLTKSDKFDRHQITPEKQLLLSIWMMATPNSYRCVSDRFDEGNSVEKR
ncbi:hypothetical protein ACS0PU_010388 [Formica fusca]